MRVKASWRAGSQQEVRKGMAGKAAGARACDLEKSLGSWSSQGLLSLGQGC